MSRRIERIIIHCTDSPNGRSLFSGTPGAANFVTPVQEIDRWHAQRGFWRMPQWRAQQHPGLTAIGYHFVITLTGEVMSGRHADEIGAHVRGYNATSLGVCLVGRDTFTQEQWAALDALVESLRELHPQAKVVGHYQLDAGKTCPNFDVPAWMDSGVPDPNHIPQA